MSRNLAAISVRNPLLPYTYTHTYRGFNPWPLIPTSIIAVNCFLASVHPFSFWFLFYFAGFYRLHHFPLKSLWLKVTEGKFWQRQPQCSPQLPTRHLYNAPSRFFYILSQSPPGVLSHLPLDPNFRHLTPPSILAPDFWAETDFGLRSTPALVCTAPCVPQSSRAQLPRNASEAGASLFTLQAEQCTKEQNTEEKKHEFINRRANLFLRPPSPLEKGNLRAAAPSPAVGGGVLAGEGSSQGWDGWSPLNIGCFIPFPVPAQ